MRTMPWGAVKPVLLALLGIAGVGAASAAPPAPVAIEHVRVLAMDGSQPQDDRTVLVEGGRIKAIGVAGELPLPEDAQRIDGRGRTLVPGLIDMHVHVPPEPGAEGDPAWRTLALLLANGVTTARSMAGHPVHLSLRERLASGELTGPRLVAAAPALHDGNTASADAARAAVAKARADGFELVKSHHLSNVDVWQAVQDAAREQGLPVGGHVVSQVGLLRAVEAKQQIEHLDGWIAALVPPESPQASIPHGQLPPPEVLAAVDRSRLPALARRMRADGAWNVPTLALFETLFSGNADVAALAAQPQMRYVAPAAVEAWKAQAAQVAGMPGLAEFGPTFTALRRDIVAALDQAGAPVMAGSDSPQAFMVSGFSLHQELAALVRAGLSPAAALAAATRTPGRYLSETAPKGTPLASAPALGVIATGAAADLVLLSADPLADIAATQRIEGVMRDGRWFDRAALDALLARVEASVR